LAFATKQITSQNKETWEKDLVFVGLVGMIDPPRKEVKAAIEKCKKAGIRPIMITGDHKATAFAIAKEVGIATSANDVLLGVEIDKLNDEEFLEKLQTVSVFARVSPENKVRIVNGFKSLGMVTAMTGDGVNDAPSLKAASIGVGMGITGTDITKDVADIIISDDNFATIVLAVEEGRKIYKNIQKTIKFLFSANLAEILSIFFATLMFPKFVFLMPIQILFVNLITDTLPAVAMSFEAAEKDLMSTNPRNSKENIFSNGVGVQIIVVGIFEAILTLLSFYLGTKLNTLAGFEHTDPSTMAFITLNLIQLVYIFSVRFDLPLFKSNIFKNNLQNFAVLAGVVVMLLFTLLPINTLLGFSYLNPIQWLIAVGCAVAILPIAELVKLILRKDK
jgi:Ca2+-transporting ATPase